MIISMLLILVSPYTAFIPCLYISYKFLTRKLQFDKNSWNIGLLLFLVWSFIVGLLNRSKLSTAASLAFFLYFCLSLYIQNHFRNESQIDSLFKYVVYFSVFSAILGIVEKVIYIFFDAQWLSSILGVVSKATISHRIYSTFGNPNIAGNWFAIMILISLYLMDKSVNKEKTLIRYVSLLFVLALSLTGSRGAYIGVMAALPIFYFLRRDKRETLFMFSILAFISLLTFFPSMGINMNAITGHLLDRSIVTRGMVWEGCFKMIGIKPLTGWGLMGVWEHSFEFINYYARESHGHNLWIGFTVTLGFVGLSIYLYMKLYLLKCLKMLYYRDCGLAALLTGIQVLIIGHGIVDFTIMAPQTGILFMASSALITSLAMEYKKLSNFSNNSIYKSLPRVG